MEMIMGHEHFNLCHVDDVLWKVMRVGDSKYYLCALSDQGSGG